MHTAIGSFDAKDSGRGRFFDPEKADLMLTGDNSVVGHYLGIAVDGEVLQCCQLIDIKAEIEERKNDSDDEDDIDQN